MTKPLTESEMDRIVESLEVWTYSAVRCAVCDHKHVSVHLIGTDRVECPKCGHMTPVEEGNADR